MGAGLLQPGDLVVTEVMFDPTCNQDDCEWIEVRNASGNTVNLNGLVIQDSQLVAGCVLAENVIVLPGDHAWIAIDDADGWPYANQPDVFCPTGPSLNNNGDLLVLRPSLTGTIIDQIADFPDASSATQGHSWKLNPASLTATANDAAANWCFSNVQFDTPGGMAEFGSPDVTNDASCLP